MPFNDSDKKFAVLIDADNISAKYAKDIIAEISNHGIATLKRIYGDWSDQKLVGSDWRKQCAEYAITQMMVTNYTIGKNASDSALIIDAMDILYTGNIDGFCIVSSDSDFRNLVSRLRESGKFVLGMGERKSTPAHQNACDQFLFLDTISTVIEGTEKIPIPENTSVQKNLIRLISGFVDKLANDDGWAYLADIGTQLTRNDPSFDPRNYGFSKLKGLVESLDSFEVTVYRAQKGNATHPYIRNK